MWFILLSLRVMNFHNYERVRNPFGMSWLQSWTFRYLFG
jgi:hypothetical protein